MSLVKVQGNASGTGIFTIASPNSNTDRTLTLPDNTGTILTTATAGVPVNGPAFSAYKSSSQSLNSATLTKVTFDQEDFDTASCFASSRFTPNVAGYYQFNAGVRSDAATVSALHTILTASTVGEFAAGTFTNTPLAGFMSSCSGLIYLNGTTDYVEVYAYSGNGVTASAGRSATYFQAFLARSAT